MVNFLRKAGKLNVYTIYLNPKAKNIYQDALFIAEHFNIFAFIFTGLWAVANRLWYIAIAIFFVQFSAAYIINFIGLSAVQYGIIDFGFRILLGLYANDLQRYSLELKGHKLSDVIVARNLLEAAHRYYGKHLKESENNELSNRLSEC
jgi:hypothetical protein